jgi:hypothetical protein
VDKRFAGGGCFFVNTPYTVLQFGKSLGSIRHWQPVRATYKIALIIRRRSTDRRPRRDRGGNSWRIDCHCRFVKSLEY